MIDPAPRSNLAGPRAIRADGLTIEPWRNGTGRKADIVAGPGWTVAYAWLDQDSAFSDYSGHDRTITLVEGPGFELCGPGGRTVVRVTEAFAPAGFDGGARLDCRILGAPCRVLNIMTEREACRHAVAILAGSGLRIGMPPPGEARVIVVMRGGATVRQAGVELRLERYDAVAVTGEAQIDGTPDCRAALFTIGPAASPRHGVADPVQD